MGTGNLMDGVSATATPTPPPSGQLTAVIVPSTDWGTGFCASVAVTNGTSTSTTNWVVTLNTNNSTIFSSWNGNFSGNSGQITVQASQSWGQVLGAGQTIESIGFCANRNASGSNLPTVVSASATF
jgi:cellulase/cellobiase CelA1